MRISFCNVLFVATVITNGDIEMTRFFEALLNHAMRCPGAVVLAIACGMLIWEYARGVAMVLQAAAQ